MTDAFDVEAEARALAGPCEYTIAATQAADEEAHSIKVRRCEDALRRARRDGAREIRVADREHDWRGADRRLQKALWDAINMYTESCGGNPSNHVYGNTKRMDAVATVERIAEEIGSGTAQLLSGAERREEALRRLRDLRKGQRVYLLCAKIDPGCRGVSQPVIYRDSLACIDGVVEEVSADTVVLRHHHLGGGSSSGEYDKALILLSPGPYPVVDQ